MQASVEPLGLLVAAIRRAVKAMVTRRVEPLGLAPLQFWVLVGALEAPGASQAELARRLRCDEPSVSRVVASLARRGWLRASRHQEDRRRVMLALTRSDRTLARRLAPIAAEVRAEVEAPLAAAEREQVRQALARVASHLQQRGRETVSTPPLTESRAASRHAGGDR
jgi:MarR family transcriptional regulator, organic hydroperoxide resistance regulator